MSTAQQRLHNAVSRCIRLLRNMDLNQVLAAEQKLLSLVADTSRGQAQQQQAEQVTNTIVDLPREDNGKAEHLSDELSHIPVPPYIPQSVFNEASAYVAAQSDLARRGSGSLDAQEFTMTQTQLTSRTLPAIPRVHAGVPTMTDIPVGFRPKQRNVSRATRDPFARLFCFYGIGDSAELWNRHFVNMGARWCQICVYEWKGYGSRAHEPFAKTYDEMAEDAWMALRPAFEQHRKGCLAEGCPFAFYGHAHGSGLVPLIAARLRREFGIEPCCVFFSSAPPPTTVEAPHRDDEGLELMMQEHNESIARARGTSAFADAVYDKYLSGWIIWFKYCNSCSDIFHAFHCPLFVFIPVEFVNFGKAALDPFFEWKHWTDGGCEFVAAQVDATTIKWHLDTETKLWQEFLRLARAGRNVP